MTRLSGRVPETGTAISGATVAIIDTQGTDDTTQWSIVASDTTDANGEWSVSGLEPSAVERYHAVAQFDSGVEFVNFESLPYLSTPADAFAPTTPVNVGTPTAEVGIPAFFDVTITNTNTPVTEGDILTVDFNVNNTGTFQDTQDIRLEIDNVEEDRDNNVTLDGGVSTTGTLQWDTTNETPAQYTATVLSNDDADSVTVQVESAIPDSVIHRYDFEDDSDTTTLTDTVGSADGSITGMSYTTNQAEDNFAGDFDGNDDFVDIPTAEGFPLSITAYIFPRVINSNQVWINWGFDFDANEGVVIKAASDGQNFKGLEVFLGDTSADFGTTDLSLTKTHIGVTIDASANVTVYFDGSNVGSASFSATGGSGQSYLGAENPTNNIADVILDNVEIHNKELTQSEVQNRM